MIFIYMENFQKIKMDFFEELKKNGVLKISGLDKNFNAYRIFIYQNKEFRITLTNE